MVSRVRLFCKSESVCRSVAGDSLQPPGLQGSRQESRSGLPCPPPGDRPKPEIKPESPDSQADFSPSEPLGKVLGQFKTLRSQINKYLKKKKKKKSSSLRRMGKTKRRGWRWARVRRGEGIHDHVRLSGCTGVSTTNCHLHQAGCFLVLDK